MEDGDVGAELISKLEYLDAVKKNYPVYGDFLSLAAFNVAALPNYMSNSVLDVSIFLREHEVLSKRMFWAYIDLALIEAGYILNDDPDAYKNANDLKETILKQGLGLSGENVGYERGELNFVSEYREERGSKSVFRVVALNEYPMVNDPDTLYYLTFQPSSVGTLIDSLLSNEDDAEPQKLKKIVVIDPLFYHLNKERIRDFKMELDRLVNDIQVYSIPELLQFLGIDIRQFDDEWTVYRSEAIRNFEDRYPFIKVRESIKKLEIGKKEINEAWADLQKGEFTERTMKELVWKSSKGVEALLGIFYRTAKGKSSGNFGIGEMLSHLRSEIEEEYGKDVYGELDFIRSMRNIADHATEEEITQKDTIKVISMAKLFLTLFEARKLT